MSEAAQKKQPRLPNFIEALIPIAVMMFLMIYDSVAETGYGDAHMPLILSIIVACLVGFLCGHSFKKLYS